ncbi:XRE family transcriptional regulator [Salmonella enterica]|nr:XRE family transcriptional regulator [Salmonella enterica]ELC5643516.1 XRE family transcriptional regulator [Salmonella enterica]ELC5653109.1 XRE family transcriptional regulator [Salmonella enterica]ELC5675131.1 XRE family transcriptional regulator [Salmonella enterica]
MYKPTSDEFKAEMKRKGWTRQALAQRWGKSERWISNISGNEEREQHWNDALAGLPVLKKTNNK